MPKLIDLQLLRRDQLCPEPRLLSFGLETMPAAALW